MVNVLLSGYDGTMGGVVRSEAERRPAEFSVRPFVAAKRGEKSTEIPPETPCDVILDFSHPSRLAGLLEYAKKHKKPLVVATTGLNSVQDGEIREASRQIPILRSSNFSLGVFKFVKAVAAFARTWEGDIEVVETHHNLKKDAPSGTALTIAQAVLQSRGGAGRIVSGRTTESGKRMPGDIGISSVRGGVVAGEHEVRFYSTGAEVTMTEREYGKQSFALGALSACAFLAHSAPGLYTMEDLVK
jgi:4-hydroxy-tetrahydrodipicolinate reductase